MKTIDIGCGRMKLPGAIGLDFSPYSMADIVIDLNTAPLPFQDNEIDLVYTSHCLEHLTYEGFFHVMAEMYRVCKPAGMIFIAVPYFHTSGNLANPFHNNQICFNEHTFRFFSSAPTCKVLSKEEYVTPASQQWGLRYSANGETQIELDLLKMEFSYFPEYEILSKQDKIKARKELNNVVDSVCYWLRPVKPCPNRFEDQQVDLEEKVLKELEKIDQTIKSQTLYIEKQVTGLSEIKAEKIPDFALRIFSPCSSVAEYLEHCPPRKFSKKNIFYEDEDGFPYHPHTVKRILDEWMIRTHFLLQALSKGIG